MHWRPCIEWIQNSDKEKEGSSMLEKDVNKFSGVWISPDDKFVDEIKESMCEDAVWEPIYSEIPESSRLGVNRFKEQTWEMWLKTQRESGPLCAEWLFIQPLYLFSLSLLFHAAWLLCYLKNNITRTNRDKLKVTNGFLTK